MGNFCERRCVFTPLMLKNLTIAFALTVTIRAATAIECRTEAPSGASEYWSWRIIDGKKCWYPGRPGISKANLYWPKTGEPTTGQGRAFETVEPYGPPSLPDLESDLSRPNGNTTFKERWPSGR
jgi:hypothetical protein